MGQVNKGHINLFKDILTETEEDSSHDLKIQKQEILLKLENIKQLELDYATQYNITGHNRTCKKNGNYRKWKTLQQD